MQHNNIKQISERSFHANVHLFVLRIDDNPLNCDCQLAWIKQNHIKIHHIKANCDSPSRLKGKSIKKLLISEFDCNISEGTVSKLETESKTIPKLEINNDVKIHNIIGSSLVLDCSESNDVFWFFKNEKVNFIEDNHYRKLSNGSLKIDFLMRKDNGNFYCQKNNGKIISSYSLEILGIKLR